MSDLNYDFLKLKNQPNPEREKRIKFVDEGHRYYIDDVLCTKEDGFTSCTAFLHSLWQEFDADMVITKMMKNVAKFNSGEYAGMTKQEIIDLWARRGAESCRLGSMMHNTQIETYLNNEPVDMEKTAEVSKEFELFLEFVKDHEALGWKPYRTEMMVFCEELKITGSIDALYEMPNGDLCIVDWKRLSKPLQFTTPYKKYSVHPKLGHLHDVNGVHYSLQLNLYRHLLNKHYNKTVTEMYLVVFHKSLEKYEKFKVPDLQDEITMLFDERLRKLQGLPEPEEEEPDITYTIDLRKCIL